MSDVPKSEAETVESGVKPGPSIDEKGGVVHLMFLAELVEEHPRGDGGSRGKQPDVEESIYSGIDRGEQPELLVIDSNDRLVNRDVIRIGPGGWL